MLIECPPVPTLRQLVTDHVLGLLIVFGLVFVMWSFARRWIEPRQALHRLVVPTGIAASGAFAWQAIKTVHWYATDVPWEAVGWDQMLREFLYGTQTWLPFALLGAVFGLLHVICRSERRPAFRSETGQS